MTINTTNIVSGPYLGNGIASAFDYTFRVDLKTDLIVFETDDLGNVTELVVDVDYVVNDIGDDGGGTIDRVAGALPSGYEWYIRSNRTPDQLTAFASQGGFYPDVHEAAFDKVTYLVLELIDKVSRALRVADSFSGTFNLQLPTPSAGKALKWNATEDGIENSTSNIDEAASAAAASAAAALVSENNALASEVAAGLSEIAAALSETNAFNSAELAELWATKLVTTVDGSDYSAKYYAQLAATIIADALVTADIGVTVQGYDVDTAKTDVIQTWTIQRTNEVTDNDGSFDLNAGQDFKCTPTAGFTLTFTNIPASPLVQHGTIILVNPNAYAVAAHANTKIGATLLANISAAGTYELAYRTSNGVAYVTASGALS